MKTTVYIDALFLLNFTVNLLLLKITDTFSKQKNSGPKIALSALFGAVYAVCMFIKNAGFLYSFVCKILGELVLIHKVHCQHDKQHKN